MTKTRSLFIAIFIICFVPFIYSQDKFADSLEKALNSQFHDTIKIDLLQELSYTLNGSNPRKAVEYALQGIKLAKKYNNLNGQAKCYNNLGSAYQSMGEYESAMNAYLKSMQIYEQLNNELGCASELSSIGFIFRQQQNYTKSIEFHLKAMNLYLKNNDEKSAAGCKVNIGNVYYSKGEYDSAITNYKEALDIYQKINAKESIATIENNIGAIYFEKKDYEKANEYFLKSYAIRENSGNKYEMATSLNNIGEVFGKQGNYSKAIEFCTKSLSIATEIGARDIMVYNYENLAGLNADINNFGEAYHFQVLNSIIKDSILNVENNKQINELSVKYETEKKEAENKVLKAEGERQKIISIAVTTGLGLVAILAFFIFKSYRQKKKANLLLSKQNTEISLQKNIIEEKNKIVEEQHRIVEEKNKDITDSIKYAKRIQLAFLPTAEFSKEFRDNAFIFYKPKDIVSGDFYWMDKKDDQLLIAAVDCTGHGVPGAFMSIVGFNLLNQAVKEHKIATPSLILDELNNGVTRTLRQYEEDSTVKDGMDIALCNIDFNTLEMQYACAYNPIWIIRNDLIIELKVDKFPVGAFVGESLSKFTNNTFQLMKGDSLYLFSDGFADQFGGQAGKKFKYKPLQQLLKEVCHKSADEQRSILERTFDNWQGSLEQVDDVLVIGIKI